MPERPDNWFERRLAEFYGFDVAALNVLGWTLFLSAVGFLIGAIIYGVDQFDDGRDRQPRVVEKVVAVVLIIGAVAWFQVGKALLGLVGLSIYRAAYRNPAPPADEDGA